MHPPLSIRSWNYLTDQGLVWGLTKDALPLPPGAVLTLTVGDAYFWPTLSQVSWPIPAGTPLYAQVDSTNKHTDYGGVLESHEMVPNGKYNNILGPVYASATEGVKLGESFAPLPLNTLNKTSCHLASRTRRLQPLARRQLAILHLYRKESWPYEN